MKKGALALTITLTAVGGLAVGAGVTFAVIKLLPDKAQPEVSKQNAPVTNQVSNSVAEEPAVTIPKDWETFESDVYDVSFSYPSEWGKPDVETFEGEQDSLFNFTEEGVTFESDLPNGFRTVRIAELDAIAEGFDADSSVDEQIEMLRAIYSDRGVDDAVDAFILPPENGSMVATTAPSYIESADGTFRGFYNYSFTSQYGTPAEPALLPELRIIMTDGDQVVSMFLRSNYEDVTELEDTELVLIPEGKAVEADSCRGAQLVNYSPKSCEIDSVLTSEFEEFYQLVVETLTNS